MYHGRFQKSHYEAGFHWGNLLYKNGKKYPKITRAGFNSGMLVRYLLEKCRENKDIKLDCKVMDDRI